MPSICIELHDGRPGPIELQIPPEKTAAKVLDACCRKLNLGVGRLSPKGKPNLFLQDDDVVAGGMTYVFTPTARDSKSMDRSTTAALGKTLKQIKEEVAIDLKRHGVSSSWPPETQPDLYPYTNNSVSDFIRLAENQADDVTWFTQAPEYMSKVGFHLITGGFGSGKTQMGTEIRRLVAHQALHCRDKSLWATAQAMHIDFNVNGEPLSSADDHIASECILGLRVAANNIFHCDLSQLRRRLSVHCQQLFSLDEVMKYLANQKRKSLGLGSDAIVLQVLTVDELQLVLGQSAVLQYNSRGLVNVIIRNLASWMISGGANKCACLTVLTGTGLEYARSALSRYEQTSRQIHHLTLSQVSNLMADSIAKVNRLTIQQAKDLLGHGAMRVQLNLLMGLPGFMDMALDVLHASLKTGLPQNDQESRQLAGRVSTGVRDKIRAKLKDDFQALGAEVVFRLLLMSLSGVTVNIEYTFISNGMTLEGVSTSSGIVWTLAHEDGVQAILPPVVQHQAVAFCLTQMQLLPWTDLLRAMQKCLPFPYNNTIDGPPFEKLVAISIASTAHLFSAGVTTVPGEHTWGRFFPSAAMSKLLGSSKFTIRALQLARDRSQLFKSTQSGGGSFDLIVDSETCLETAGNLNSHLPWDIPTSLSSWTLSLDLLHLPEI